MDKQYVLSGPRAALSASVLCWLVEVDRMTGIRELTSTKELYDLPFS